MAVLNGRSQSVLALFAVASGFAVPGHAAAQAATTKSTQDSDGSTRADAAAGTHSGITPARPNGRISDWVTDDDYPRISLQNNVTGIVKFHLSIAADGSASACEVLGQGVNAELNQQTCAIMMKRAHFFPATDAAGKRVMGSYYSSVTWQIPDIAHPLPPTSINEATFDVKPDGTVTNCVLKQSGFRPANLGIFDEKKICAGIGHFERPVDAAGKPVGKHIVAIQSTIVTDLP